MKLKLPVISILLILFISICVAAQPPVPELPILPGSTATADATETATAPAGVPPAPVLPELTEEALAPPSPTETQTAQPTAASKLTGGSDLSILYGLSVLNLILIIVLFFLLFRLMQHV